MKQFIGVVLAVTLLAAPASGDDKQAQAALDNAIKALGGADKLDKVKAMSWKAKGTITINGDDSAFTSQATAQGLDRYRSEFEGEFGGNKVKGVTVVNGSKGWRKFGDMNMELDADGLANEKRTIYLTIAATTLVPLRGKGFKVETAGEEKVADKPAIGLKVTGPDGKDFRLFLDKESGLPVKLVAKVVGFGGEEHNQETTYAAYKDFGGIKKATRIVTKRDGEKFLQQEITDFKTDAKVDAKTFGEPE
jgi:hypothetical protein